MMRVPSVLRPRSSVHVAIPTEETTPERKPLNEDQLATRQPQSYLVVGAIAVATLVLIVLIGAIAYSTSSNASDGPTASHRSLVVIDASPAAVKPGALTTTLPKILKDELAKIPQPARDIPLIFPLMFKTITRCQGHRTNEPWREANVITKPTIDLVNDFKYSEFDKLCADGQYNKQNVAEASAVIAKVFMNTPPMFKRINIEKLFPQSAYGQAKSPAGKPLIVLNANQEANVVKLLKTLSEIERKVLYHLLKYCEFMVENQTPSKAAFTMERLSAVFASPLAGPYRGTPKKEDPTVMKYVKNAGAVLTYIATNFKAKGATWFAAEVEWAKTPKSLLNTYTLWAPEEDAESEDEGGGGGDDVGGGGGDDVGGGGGGGGDDGGGDNGDNDGADGANEKDDDVNTKSPPTRPTSPVPQNTRQRSTARTASPPKPNKHQTQQAQHDDGAATNAASHSGDGVSLGTHRKPAK